MKENNKTLNRLRFWIEIGFQVDRYDEKLVFNINGEKIHALHGIQFDTAFNPPKSRLPNATNLKTHLSINNIVMDK